MIINLSGLKKSVPGYARLHKNFTKVISQLQILKKTVQIIKFVIITVGPLFLNSETGNRTK